MRAGSVTIGFSFWRTTGSGSVSMMVLPYDFDILRPSVPGSLGAGVSSDLRLGENLAALAAVEPIKPPRDFPRQFDVRDLVFADRDKSAL